MYWKPLANGWPAPRAGVAGLLGLGRRPARAEVKPRERWLTVDADRSVIFDTPVEERYDKALALLGLQAWMISSQVGHA